MTKIKDKDRNIHNLVKVQHHNHKNNQHLNRRKRIVMYINGRIYVKMKTALIRIKEHHLKKHDLH